MGVGGWVGERQPSIEEVFLCERRERNLHLSQEGIGHDGAFFVEEDVDDLGVGGWVGGWVAWVEENETVRMLWVG